MNIGAILENVVILNIYELWYLWQISLQKLILEELQFHFTLSHSILIMSELFSWQIEWIIFPHIEIIVLYHILFFHCFPMLNFVYSPLCSYWSVDHLQLRRTSQISFHSQVYLSISFPGLSLHSIQNVASQQYLVVLDLSLDNTTIHNSSRPHKALSMLQWSVSGDQYSNSKR